MTSDRDFFLIEIEDRLPDYAELFANTNPVYIEIGSGKGEFISGYPKIHPEWNFIGFELREKRINTILKKLSPTEHPNVRLARRFIDPSITDFLHPQSIQGVFIQHPDPWPKRKHHRRRLINQTFLNALVEIMAPDAFVQVSTDHEDYATWIADEFTINPYFSAVYDDLIMDYSVLDEHIVTWFEQEQKRQGYHPKYMLFKKL
ncbi:MAG: tRNA (guanosine(46)-N7)-methyltransferase TrmB [Candidatus Cloacimonadaceae bacterium]|nr:tRNA (guanosine(46)-N7)-methyltransferase TrmB [Candidatus Cloacimonadaceae bacterium]